MSSQYKHIQLRRDTQQELNAANPKLKAGEPAFATDSSILKIGDGTHNWNDLPNLVSHYRTAAFDISLPAISQGDTHTVNLTVSGIDASDEYSVVATPDSTLPNGVMIWYASVASSNTITIKFININTGDVDGGDVSTSTDTSSSSSATVRIHLLLFNTTHTSSTTTTTTTTTPLPLFEDAHSFGYNKYGQLGLGSDKPDEVTSPTLIANEKWTDFALGNFHTIAISKASGLLVAGYNYYGQLGLGSSSVGANSSDFTAVDKVYFEDGTEYASNISWSGVAAGSQYSLAIDESGHLYSCGDGSYGSLGHGDTVARNKFTIIGDQNYIEDLQRNISNSISSSSFDLGSTRTKFVADSGVYRLDNIPSSNPVRVITSASTDIIEITGQNTQTINGDVYYDGYLEIDVSGDYGVLSLYSKDGFLDNGQNLIFYRNPNTGWTDVDAGNYHSVGIKHGELYSWGNNAFGQLADNSNSNKSVPAKVLGSKTDWISVAAGSLHTLALDSSGDVYSAGNNTSGQLGIGTKQNKDTLNKIDFDLTSLSDNHFSTLGEGSDIAVASYEGQNRYFLNYEAGKDYDPLEKFVVGIGSYVISGVPQSHPIAVLNAGSESCVQYNGENKAGRLRLVNTTADGIYDFYYGDVSINITCEFDMLSLYCLHHGYMGGENILYYDTPNYSFSEIDAGFNHSVVRSNADQLLTFGENEDGQLGTGDKQDRTVPYRLGTQKVKKISAAGNQTFFVDDQNYIWAFGNNEHGQLGLGDKESRKLPTRINSDIRWATVHAGGSHTVSAVKSYLPTAPIIDYIHTGLHKYLRSTNFTQEAQGSYNDINAGSRQVYIKFNEDYAKDKYLEEGVTDFIVEYSTDNTNWTRSTERCGNLDPDKEYTYNILHEKLDDLTNNTDYYLRVAAVNEVGSGVHTIIPNTVRPSRATDSQQSNVFFYSNMDKDALGDVYNTNSLNWVHTSGFLNSEIDSLGKRYPEGVGAESVRLYQHDYLSFETTNVIEDLTEFTLEFWFNPRGIATNAEILTIASGTTDQFSITYNGSDATVDNQALHNGYSFKVRDAGGTTIIETATMPTTLYETGLKNSLGQYQDKALNNCENFEHLALVKTSGNTVDIYDTFELYYNGVKVGTGTDNTSYDVDTIVLASGTTAHDFSIDELRLTSGVRYDTGFDSITKDISISKPYQ